MEQTLAKKRLRLRGWQRFLGCALGAVLFLGVVYLVAYRHADLWNLWLPISEYNDEVYYNKELLGILAGGGQPQGVFGYNESGAVLGHFSVWGPVVFYLYLLPALVVGAGVNTMFWCNILLFVVGWTIFCAGNRLAWKRQALFALLLVAMWFPVQQVYTGLSEVLHYLLIWVILTGTSALQRRFRGWMLVVVCVACALETIMRAYLVLLWIFPLVVLWRQYRRWLIPGILAALVSLGGYQLSTVYFSSPYLPDAEGVDLTALSLMAQGKIPSAVVYEVARVWDRLHALWEQYVRPTFDGNGPEQGGVYLITLILLLVTVLCTVYDLRHGKPVWRKVCALAVTAISLLALLSFYTLDPMSRHCIMLDLLLVSALVMEEEAPVLRFAPLVWVALILVPGNFALHTLPTYDARMDAQMTAVHTALTESQAALDSTDPWDRTVAFGSREGVFEGYLYAVPDGMGLQYDRSYYLSDPGCVIRSRYVMVGHGTEAEGRLLADGWQELVSTEDLIVYERPQAGA